MAARKIRAPADKPKPAHSSDCIYRPIRTIEFALERAGRRRKLRPLEA